MQGGILAARECVLYKILLYQRTSKVLNSLEEAQQARIRHHLKELAAWPVSHRDITMMAGDFKGYYRLRIGQLRPILVVNEASKTIC